MTSTEIAKLAGVSRSTVSRVINGYSNVPPETKEKVMEMVERYGYTPNNSARNLVGKPSRIVGLFFVALESRNRSIIHDSPFFSEFLTYFADSLQDKGYQLLVSVISTEQHMKNMQASFQNQLISGGVFMGDPLPQEELEHLSQRGHKVLLVNQKKSCTLEHVLLLNTENYKAVYEAVKVLIDLGHKRIGHIAGSLENCSTRDRYDAYMDCLRDHNLPIQSKDMVFTNIHRQINGYNAIGQMWEQTGGDLPSAIFCSNDLIAMGAMDAIAEKNLHIPEDISLIGYDNMPVSKFTSPPLSTISTSVENLSLLAGRMLLSLIENHGSQLQTQAKIQEECQLLLRESVSAPKPS